jgi:hypothetical protein
MDDERPDRFAAPFGRRRDLSLIGVPLHWAKALVTGAIGCQAGEAGMNLP